MIESNREIKKPSEKREIMPRFEASALRGYCVSVLTASGVERSCAEAVADALIDAELTGVSTHGVSRLAVYMQRMDAGVMSRENNIRIVRESTSTLVVDAGNSLGAAAAKFAMERCIAKAKETGCCFASVHSSNHFGTAAYYTRLAAAQDMIGFACTNLKGKIAPFGSAEPYMGTNPISVAAPSDDLPVVLDMAPSVVALGKLILAQKLGKSIPEGWALDKDGHPSTDAKDVLKNIVAKNGGGIMPLGGNTEQLGSHKGYGYGMLCEIFCSVFSQGTPSSHVNVGGKSGTCHGFMAVDPNVFGNAEEIKAHFSEYLRELRNAPKADGAARIYTHGEKEVEAYADRMKNGIDVNINTVAEMIDMAKYLGMDAEKYLGKVETTGLESSYK